MIPLWGIHFINVSPSSSPPGVTPRIWPVNLSSLHPFMADYQRALVNGYLAPKFEKNVVFIDLVQMDSGIKTSLRKGHRSSIAAARKAGAQIAKVDTSAPNLANFLQMYKETMVRRRAADRWFVPDGYFENCVHHLGADRSSLFFAIVDGEIESGCFLMHDFSTVYYHFAGTYATRPALGINNLMVYETAVWAHSANFRRYHLGGGVTSSDGDSLLRFKSGFSDLRAPLYTYFCVRDKAVYDRLCKRKRIYEAAAEGASLNPILSPSTDDRRPWILAHESTLLLVTRHLR